MLNNKKNYYNSSVNVHNIPMEFSKQKNDIISSYTVMREMSFIVRGPGKKVKGLLKNTKISVNNDILNLSRDNSWF